MVLGPEKLLQGKLLQVRALDVADLSGDTTTMSTSKMNLGCTICDWHSPAAKKNCLRLLPLKINTANDTTIFLDWLISICIFCSPDETAKKSERRFRCVV